jgi:hypothetical protein
MQVHATHVGLAPNGDSWTCCFVYESYTLMLRTYVLCHAAACIRHAAVQVTNPPFRVWVMDAVHTRYVDKMIDMNMPHKTP